MKTTVESILNEFREAATSKRDMGDKFERLIASALKLDSGIAGEFSNVWLWAKFPYRENQPDTGIDLVGEEAGTGEYVAIQCKFYHPDHELKKEDIDSFFTASGKSFKTKEGKKEFSRRIIVSTTEHWSKHAENALVDQNPPVARIGIQNLSDSIIDWEQFSLDQPEKMKAQKKKTLRPHQKDALHDVAEGFKTSPRGKLIMACGTGKTFTSLKIMENLTKEGDCVLFLVPSIALLSQTLREWVSQADMPLHCVAVCSDTKVGKSEEDMTLHDLPYPATTDAKMLKQQFESVDTKKKITVVFSTYQSIKVVSAAQKTCLPEFSLVICDEAHRTTGAKAEGDDDSAFVAVHDEKIIKARKRLYMTATPRIYSDAVKAKAKESSAEFWSMDEEKYYGPEFHRLGFSQAVSKGLLSDYRVVVLAVDEKHVSKAFQSQIADENSEINLDVAVKIVGCWNGLSKRTITQTGEEDTTPMKRAVAFNRTIKASESIQKLFSSVVAEYIEKNSDKDALACEIDHVDGGMNVLVRNDKLKWLKDEPTANTCRILTNARCLSEGVDVPALDAVMFLSPRNSVVDVVQSVGRVMRRADGKKYGYIILPIGIPADMKPEDALQNNEKYKVVWQVLQALRAHDDRFNAIVNNVEIIGVNGKPASPKDPNAGPANDDGDSGHQQPDSGTQISFGFANLEDWKSAIYAKIVQRCGQRKYWEEWAKDVADIAARHVARIKALLENPKPEHKEAFDSFLEGLHQNINPSISQDEAIEMLAQHLITRPVFDALFENYSFVKNNPVSTSMQKILNILDGQALEKEVTSLKRFYDDIKNTVTGVTSSDDKQKIILEIYDKFFKHALPEVSDRLGIVYTPVEVVDFIIKSTDEVLRQEFGKGLTDEGIHILDPFTGTGTFIVRLLQSGLIKNEDLFRKYTKELHANEIVLLAYYLATINIEETFHGMTGAGYRPFSGTVLTDTFQMYENEGTLHEIMFPDNSQRVTKQKRTPINIVIGNPPYSAKQTTANDNNKNLQYEKLDEAIRSTYAEKSCATNKTNLYDSYIRAIRWSSDRIKDRGIVAFVTNGSFLDGNAADGLRKCLVDEFSSIYCFNLRGNQRTSGELSRQEGGKIFGSGSRTPVAITILVRNPEKQGSCRLRYHDIGDYLTREEKLKIIKDFESIKNISWQNLTPNKEGDWINLRDPRFNSFVKMGAKEDSANTIFEIYSGGIKTGRDAWLCNYRKAKVEENSKKTIAFYNKELSRYKECIQKKSDVDIDKFVDSNPLKISWNRGLKQDLEKCKKHNYDNSAITQVLYRPFTKQWVYFSRSLNDMVYRMPSIFPIGKFSNISIVIPGPGATKDFSCIVTNVLPDLNLQSGGGQNFPLYYYEPDGRTLNNAMTSFSLQLFNEKYNFKITHEDIFFYIYGIFHSSEYKHRFSSDLKKMLPRIPFAKDFWAFSKAGRLLAELHLNYETISPYPQVLEIIGEFILDPKKDFKVQKMRFGKKEKEEDKTTIIYNSKITLTGIPLEAYEYIVNGKSAIEWVMEQYSYYKDKDSEIVNDPNDWSEDPRYIIDLVKRIVTVSIETMKIIKSLPPLQELN